MFGPQLCREVQQFMALEASTFLDGSLVAQFGPALFGCSRTLFFQLARWKHLYRHATFYHAVLCRLSPCQAKRICQCNVDTAWLFLLPRCNFSASSRKVHFILLQERFGVQLVDRLVVCQTFLKWSRPFNFSSPPPRYNSPRQPCDPLKVWTSLYLQFLNG